MNEHEMEARIGEKARTLPVVVDRKRQQTTARSDLVVDLSGIRDLDMTSLAILLTAQQSAQQENRAIWLAGVPLGMWRALHEMGLGRFFRPFPVSTEVVA